MEAKYQLKLKRHFERCGWTVIKIIRATVNGYPDLMLCRSDRPPVFIEVKADGGKTSKIQDYRINELRSNGFKVIVAYPSDFDAICSDVK